MVHDLKFVFERNDTFENPSGNTLNGKFNL